MTTNAKKPITEPSAEQPKSEAIPHLGPPLRPGQTPERVVFAHHLRVAGGTVVQPGDTAYLSPDYARQLRGSGYLARTRS
ncbi:hypothetical protein AB0O47_32040 [Streptomyces noursei]|uniref:hypothetical protein n=1 Tax=Streptomyces noursei TaxID=1971 RepID=UPI00344E23D3